MKIYGTGKSQHMPKGSVFNETEEMAKLLVEIGAASYEEVKDEPKEKEEVKDVKEKQEVKETKKAKK